MAKESVICYAIPALPHPLLIPVEGVAAVLKNPQLEKMSEARASWMRGHVTWNNQRLPVLSYTSLHDSKYDDSKESNLNIVVLNPIPDAVRKAYSGLLCHGELQQVGIDDRSTFCDRPDNMDKRYIEGVLEQEGTIYIIPKLSALEVAFSYF